jgi:hypothetical protein
VCRRVRGKWKVGWVEGRGWQGNEQGVSCGDGGEVVETPYSVYMETKHDCSVFSYQNASIGSCGRELEVANDR